MKNFIENFKDRAVFVGMAAWLALQVVLAIAAVFLIISK